MYKPPKNQKEHDFMRKGVKKKKENIPECLCDPLTKMLKLNKPLRKKPLPKHNQIFDSKLTHKLNPVTKQTPAERKPMQVYQRRD